MKSTLHKTLIAAMVIGVLLTLPAPVRAGLDGDDILAAAVPYDTVDVFQGTYILGGDCSGKHRATRTSISGGRERR